jgi:hypothetical protein
MFRFFSKNDRLRYSALGILLIIVILGVLFLVLNVLDINENYRLHLPTNILNVIFVTAPAVPLVYISAKLFISSGSPELLALGGAQLALGINSILKIWLDNTNWWIPVTLYEGIGVLAALIFLFGGITVITRSADTTLRSVQKKWALTLSYTGIMVIIAIITLLGIKNILPISFSLNANEISIQDIIQVSATVMLFITSFIFYRIYMKSRSDFSFWYLLGVLSLAFGVFFRSQDNIDSKLVWLGRATEYFSSICFLAGVIRNNHRNRLKVPISQIQ